MRYIFDTNIILHIVRNSSVWQKIKTNYNFSNSKIFISTAVPSVYVDRLKSEMDKFPYWHDDGLDAMSYLYDLMKEYHFSYWQDDVVPEYEAVNPNIGY